MSDVRHYVAAVIRDGAGRFLTVHHSKKSEHQWRFPGGKIAEGELPIIAVARELQEELGIAAEDLRYITAYTTDVDGGKWMGHFYLLNRYVGEVVLQEPDKHDDWAYLYADELLRYDSHPEFEVADELIRNSLHGHPEEEVH